jgi:hypothetical protein
MNDNINVGDIPDIGLKLSDEGDDGERIKRFTKEFESIFGDESGSMLEFWSDSVKNYFDFRLQRPKEQPDNDSDDLAPSMKSIDTVAVSIKGFLLARLTQRMETGGDHQNMIIRITVDDGTTTKPRPV